MREPVVTLAACYALLPLLFGLCRHAPTPPGACDPPRTSLTRQACAYGPQAVEGPARLLFGGRLDPNRASPEALELVPGIGPRRAAAIVAAREARPFERLADLARVHGIGSRSVAGWRPWLSVDRGIAEAGSASPPFRGDERAEERRGDP